MVVLGGIPEGVTIFTELPRDAITPPLLRIECERGGTIYGFALFGPSREQERYSQIDLHLLTALELVQNVSNALGEKYVELKKYYLELEAIVPTWVRSDGRRP